MKYIDEPSAEEMKLILQFVDFDIFSKVKIYVDLLTEYNQKINLIGKNTYNLFWTRHVIDALQFIRHLNFRNNIIDLGSGNGIPGILLAISGFKVTLVEKSALKSEFLRLIINTLKLSNAKIINSKVESLDRSLFLK